MQCSMRSFPRVWLARTFTSEAKKRPSLLKDTVSLDHFLQRGKAIALWRTIIRDCRRIRDVNTKKETLEFARDEFKRNKDVNDVTQIRYLISTGKTQWDTMSRYIDGL